MAVSGGEPRQLGSSLAFPYRLQVTDAALKELTEFKNLQPLDLIATQVTNIGLRNLAGLKNLKALILSCTRLTDVG